MKRYLDSLMTLGYPYVFTLHTSYDPPTVVVEQANVASCCIHTLDIVRGIIRVLHDRSHASGVLLWNVWGPAATLSAVASVETCG
jgi:hypothetical protein